MEPDIKDGSLIFVDKSKKDINDKDIFLVNTIDGVFVKSIKVNNDKVILKSNNLNYKDLLFNINKIVVIGKVCGVLIKI